MGTIAIGGTDVITAWRGLRRDGGAAQRGGAPQQGSNPGQAAPASAAAEKSWMRQHGIWVG